MSNINSETNIRYGVISSNTINQFVFQDIFDLVYDQFYQECLDLAIEEEGLSNPENDDDYENLDIFEQDFADNFSPDEIFGDFELDGIKGHLSCLGGSYIIFICESPYITKARLCSPCAPNAGNLDEKDLEGFDCYDCPADWYEQE